MRQIEQVYMWALGLLGAVVVVRWPLRVLVVAAGLVAWTAVGPWACCAVIAAGLVVPVLWRVRRDGLSLDRWSQ